MRLFFACMLLAALAMPLAAADIGGKWTGRVEFKLPDGGTDGGDAYAELKQSGETITGVAGQNETEAVPIQKGKLVGDKLTLELSLPGDAGPRLFKLSLKLVSANKMEGEVEGVTNDGNKLTGKITLERKTS